MYRNLPRLTVAMVALVAAGVFCCGCCYIFECEKPAPSEVRYVAPPPPPPPKAPKAPKAPKEVVTEETYLEWHEEHAPRVELSCSNAKQAAGDVALRLRLLDSRVCGADRSFAVSVMDVREGGHDLCAFPERNNRFLVAELAVSNQRSHVLQFDRFLPVLAFSGLEFMAPTAVEDAFSGMWAQQTVHLPHPQAPHGCTNCVESIGVAEVGGLAGIAKRHSDLARESFVLPKSKRTFYFAFRIPDGWLQAEAEIPFVLGFYDLAVSSVPSGIPSLVTYFEFRCVASVSIEAFQVGELKHRSVVLLVPGERVGEVPSEKTVPPGGGDSSAPASAVTAVDLRDSAALADAPAVLKNWIGKTVTVKTKKGKEHEGVMKGLWGLSLSLEVDGASRSFQLTDLDEVRVVK